MESNTYFRKNFSIMSWKEPTVSGSAPKQSRFKWEKRDEEILLNIIHTADKGVLRKVIVEYDTNIKLNRYDAWSRVT